MSNHSVRAWLLEFSQNRIAAVGLHELVEVLSRPKRYHVPLTTPRCHQVLAWRDQILPVVNLGVTSESGSDEPATGSAVTAIAAYQRAPGEQLRHGALELSVMPRTVTVADSMACALSDSSPVLNELAIACFSYENLAVPVIDLARMFERVPGN